MDRNIEKLEPQVVWSYFKQLTQIPRPSKHEEKVREYLIATAKSLGLTCSVSPIGNVTIRKEATDTTEPRKKIVLQAHMDMVASKTPDSQHNFLTDPIDAYIDGEWVTANQTTLGADNGMGVAMGLAVLASNNIKHNDIELLVTVDEEAGMTGAFGLIGNEISGEVLLNLDSENDEEVCIGCAGGINTNITYPINYIDAKAGTTSLKIVLTGLFSGHSGCDITLGRANAIKEMASLLLQLNAIAEFDLALISGGKLRNVIPGYCEAVINVANDKIASIKEFVTNYGLELSREFALSDPNLKLLVQDHAFSAKVIEPQQSAKFLFALVSVFNGAWRVNNTLGIAETSSNIGVVSTHPDRLEVITLQRSAINSAKTKMANMVATAFKQIGATVEHADSYPGWQPNTDSPALAVVCQTYRELFNEEMIVGATHGGLECGLIMDKFPTLDAISIGATICFPHSPNEKVNIESVAKSWKLLVALIEKL